MRVQIPGRKWFPLLNPGGAERSEAKRKKNSARVSAPSCESHDAL